MELLEKWNPVDVDDALELLSSNPNFKHPTVRTYGVTRLKQASDEDLVSSRDLKRFRRSYYLHYSQKRLFIKSVIIDLMSLFVSKQLGFFCPTHQVLYLLQLVQALKYENHQEILQDVERSLGRHASDSSITMAIEPQLRQRKSGGGGGGTSAVGKTGSSVKEKDGSDQREKTLVANMKTDESSSLLKSGSSIDEDEDDDDNDEEGRVVVGAAELDAAPDMAVSMADAMAEFDDGNALNEKTISPDDGAAESAAGNESSSSSSHLASSLHSDNVESRLRKQHESRFDAPIDLATFLIFRACNNFVLASNLYW